MKFSRKRRGSTVSYIAFPCIFLAILVILDTGGLTGQTQLVCFNNTNAQCVISGNSVKYSCPPATGFVATPCQIQNSCSPQLPPPAYCYLGAEYLNPGDTLITGITQTSNQGLFNFGTIGNSGLIGMIGVAVGVAVLAGVQIFGSGLNTMSVKILFIGGVMTGIYLFLASLEGVLTGSSASWFVQADNALASVQIPPLPGVAFILMSIFEAWGIVGFVAGNESGA